MWTTRTRSWSLCIWQVCITGWGSTHHAEEEKEENWTWVFFLCVVYHAWKIIWTKSEEKETHHLPGATERRENALEQGFFQLWLAEAGRGLFLDGDWRESFSQSRLRLWCIFVPKQSFWLSLCLLLCLFPFSLFWFLCSVVLWFQCRSKGTWSILILKHF